MLLKTRPYILLFLVLGAVNQICSQQKVTISIVTENPLKAKSSVPLEKYIQEEISQLLRNKYEIVFKETYTGTEMADIIGALDEAFRDPDIDVLIAAGGVASSLLALRDQYPKPAISAVILDRELQNAAITDQQTSGIDNYTYVQSPFDVSRDIRKFQEIYPFKNLGIIVEGYLEESLSFFKSNFAKAAKDMDVKMTFITPLGSAEATVSSIPEEVEAVYVLPFFSYSDSSYLSDLFERINARKLPSMSLFGESYIEAGCLLAYESDANINRLPRRIALNVLKILEGKNASELPVLMPTYQQNLILNFATAHAIGIYPNWDVMASSIVVNYDKVHADRLITLHGAIAEALQNNLQLKITSSEFDISEKDILIARGKLLPQVDVATSISQIDATRARASFGTQGSLNLFGEATLSQIIFSEPALANIEINKMLSEGKRFALEREQMDLVLDVVNAYLGVLQAKSFLTIQGENVKVTQENLDISKAKEQVGYSGISDLNRWKSEIALKNIDFNDAVAQLENAKFNLNKVLNRPIDDEFDVEDVNANSQGLLATDLRLENVINNHGDMHLLADFLVNEAMDRLPFLKQLNTNISVQQRFLKSSERAIYVPSAALTAQLDHVLQKWNLPSGVSPMKNDPQWSIGVGVKYPIFQGKTRKYAIEQDKLILDQLKDQYLDTEQVLELQVRSLMETAIASYRRVDLSQTAADASRQNFNILQDLYNQGQVNITSLIDAQNSSVLTDLTAVNAEYTFIADFIGLERAMGFYFFLAMEEEQNAFVSRLVDFITSK